MVLADSSIVNIVIHTASSIGPGLALPLITALGRRKEAIGEGIFRSRKGSHLHSVSCPS